MERINGDACCCATCELWQGDRKLNRMEEVEVLCKNDTGKCAIKNGENHEAQHCCREYYRWIAVWKED